MRFIGSVIEKLQRHPKRIVFPEGAEPRVLQAARQFHALRLGAPILLGDRTQVKQTAADLNISLEGIRVINPSESEELENFTHRFHSLRREKGIKEFTWKLHLPHREHERGRVVLPLPHRVWPRGWQAASGIAPSAPGCRRW